MVRALADEVGTRPPDRIVMVNNVNAYVHEFGPLLGLLRGRRTLAIGAPLLDALDVSQLRAVLGHELGHFAGGDTKSGPIVYRTAQVVQQLGAVVEGWPAEPDVRPPVALPTPRDGGCPPPPGADRRPGIGGRRRPPVDGRCARPHGRHRTGRGGVHAAARRPARAGRSTPRRPRRRDAPRARRPGHGRHAGVGGRRRRPSWRPARHPPADEGAHRQGHRASRDGHPHARPQTRRCAVPRSAALGDDGDGGLPAVGDRRPPAAARAVVGVAGSRRRLVHAVAGRRRRCRARADSGCRRASRACAPWSRPDANASSARRSPAAAGGPPREQHRRDHGDGGAQRDRQPGDRHGRRAGDVVVGGDRPAGAEWRRRPARRLGRRRPRRELGRRRAHPDRRAGPCPWHRARPASRHGGAGSPPTAELPPPPSRRSSPPQRRGGTRPSCRPRSEARGGGWCPTPRCRSTGPRSASTRSRRSGSTSRAPAWARR